VSGSGAWMRGRICAASDKSSIVGLEEDPISPASTGHIIVIERTYHSRKISCRPVALRRDPRLRVTFPRPVTINEAGCAWRTTGVTYPLALECIFKNLLWIVLLCLLLAKTLRLLDLGLFCSGYPKPIALKSSLIHLADAARHVIRLRDFVEGR